MHQAIRRLLPVVFAVLLLAATAPGAAAVTPNFPTQSLGNRGVDVHRIDHIAETRAENHPDLRPLKRRGATPA